MMGYFKVYNSALS